MHHSSIDALLPSNPRQQRKPIARAKALDENSSHSGESSARKGSTAHQHTIATSTTNIVTPRQAQFRTTNLPDISRPPNQFYRIHQLRERSCCPPGPAFAPHPPVPRRLHNDSANIPPGALPWTRNFSSNETVGPSADPIPQLVASPPALPLILTTSAARPSPPPSSTTAQGSTTHEGARPEKESNALSLPKLVVESSSTTVSPNDRPLRPSRPPQSNPGIAMDVTPPSSSVTPLPPPPQQHLMPGLSSVCPSPCSGAEGMLSSAAVTPSARRASSIHSASARDAAKKAAQRILKLMFRINVTTSSPLIVLLKQIPSEILSRVLHQKARAVKRRLNKADFLDFMNTVVDEGTKQAHASSPLSSAIESSMLVPQRRKSATSLTSTTVSVVATEGPSNLVAQPGLPPRAPTFHREDTDVIFHLFDEGETGYVGTKHVCDNFFTTALATKADIVARLVTMIFASPSYHNLESTISRVEVQLTSQLLCEVFQESEAGFQGAVQRMAEFDRNALVAFEAMHPKTSFPAEDESEANREIQCRHEWLRGMANQTPLERESRLRLLLSAVSRFPDVLCDRPTGSLLIRELRDACARETFPVYGEEVTLAHGWRKQRKSVLQSQMRYDEAFLQLVQYVGQGPAQPSASRLATRASHVAMAASSMQLRSSARKSGVSLTSTRSEWGSGPDGGDDDAPEDDDSEDPVLAEALRFQQLKSQQQQFALATHGKRSVAGGRERFLGRAKPAALGGAGSSTPRATAENPSQADLFRKALHRHHSVPATDPQRMSPKSSFSDIRRVESTAAPLPEMGSPTTTVAPFRKRTSVVTISQGGNNGSSFLANSSDRFQDIDFPPEHDMPQFDNIRGRIYVRTLSCPTARLIDPEGRNR